MQTRAMGIAAVLLVGTTYSTYRLWKARKTIKQTFKESILHEYKEALEKYTHKEIRAYRFIIGFFEKTWKTELRGISCQSTLGKDLFFDHLPFARQTTFVDSLEEEFSVELPTIKELERLTIRDLMMLCVHESEEDHKGF